MAKALRKTVMVSEKHLYKCDRCKIDSSGDRLCPCPRGDCEAEIVATIRVTTTVRLFPKKKKSK